MKSNLVSMEWLKDHLQDRNLRIADCRFILGQPNSGREAYERDHIPGSIYFDLEEDLSGPKQKHGGRHPLPEWEKFAAHLGQAGIDRHTTVVAYDDQGGAMASRFWWMLQYLGHTACYVLDGGYTQWKERGYPVTKDVTMPEPAVFQADYQTDMLVGMEEVRRRKDEPGVVLIDSREEKRYLGFEELVDPVAGHIPGAVNYFWKGVLNEQGTWKSRKELQEQFGQLDPGKEVIVYCGSGVTACPNILGLREAGFSNVKLYAGSWSDWCSYPENPVAREEK